jgi:hypothetical protein
MQHTVVPSDGVHSIPATRPAVLVAYGRMRAMDHAVRLLSQPGIPFAQAADELVVWATGYIDAALARLRGSVMQHHHAALEDPELAADVIGHTPCVGADLMEIGSATAAAAVKAIVLMSRVGCADSREGVMALVHVQRREAAIRWTAEWGQLLREYPWLRSRHRWPAFTVSPLNATRVFFRIDTKRHEDPFDVPR